MAHDKEYLIPFVKGDVLDNKKNSKLSKNSNNNESWLKYLSLFILVFQNAIQVLLIRYSKIRDKEEKYLSTSAVFLTEIVKLFASILMICFQESSIKKCLTLINEQIVKKPIDTLWVAVPALIYTVQNNLLYVAVTNLDAASFMVTYQLKVLTTALFTVWLLRRPLSWLQWFSLFLLFVGISLVQLNDQTSSSEKLFTKSPKIAQNNFHQSNFNSSPQTVSQRIKNDVENQNPTLGLITVIIACLLSGFCGIYIEKILKSTPSVSIWIRNVQLAVLSVPIAYITMMITDGDMIWQKGMLYGYDYVVWLTVHVYALGGLTVAVVIKYADNILKGFATSAAILVSCVASMFLFNFTPTNQFIYGTGLVLLAIFFYSKHPSSSSSSSLNNK